MFSVNDMVNYGATGVCKIVEITTCSFQGKGVECYVLKPLQDEKATLYVPVAGKASAEKIRPMLSAREVLSIIRSMPQAEPLWVENDRQRCETYKTILAAGRTQETVCLLKALYQYKQQMAGIGKKLRVSDEQLMKDAERALFSEFAFALELAPEQVPAFIRKEIAANTQ